MLLRFIQQVLLALMLFLEQLDLLYLRALEVPLQLLELLEFECDLLLLELLRVELLHLDGLAIDLPVEPGLHLLVVRIHVLQTIDIVVHAAVDVRNRTKLSITAVVWKVRVLATNETASIAINETLHFLKLWVFFFIFVIVFFFIIILILMVYLLE